MNDATRVELAAASLLVVHATNLMVPHHNIDDLHAAIQGVLIKALEMVTEKELRPLEELFSND